MVVTVQVVVLTQALQYHYMYTIHGNGWREIRVA